MVRRVYVGEEVCCAVMYSCVLTMLLSLPDAGIAGSAGSGVCR